MTEVSAGPLVEKYAYIEIYNNICCFEVLTGWTSGRTGDCGRNEVKVTFFFSKPPTVDRTKSVRPQIHNIYIKYNPVHSFSPAYIYMEYG
jgi:hypothetical protein